MCGLTPVSVGCQRGEMSSMVYRIQNKMWIYSNTRPEKRISLQWSLHVFQSCVYAEELLTTTALIDNKKLIGSYTDSHICHLITRVVFYLNSPFYFEQIGFDGIKQLIELFY